MASNPLVSRKVCVSAFLLMSRFLALAVADALDASLITEFGRCGDVAERRGDVAERGRGGGGFAAGSTWTLFFRGKMKQSTGRLQR